MFTSYLSPSSSVLRRELSFLTSSALTLYSIYGLLEVSIIERKRSKFIVCLKTVTIIKLENSNLFERLAFIHQFSEMHRRATKIIQSTSGRLVEPTAARSGNISYFLFFDHS